MRDLTENLTPSSGFFHRVSLIPQLCWSAASLRKLVAALLFAWARKPDGYQLLEEQSTRTSLGQFASRTHNQAATLQQPVKYGERVGKSEEGDAVTGSLLGPAKRLTFFRGQVDRRGAFAGGLPNLAVLEH